MKQLVHLDAGELFTQLRATTTLVKIGPKRGLFLSSVGVSDGVLRLFRNWLAEQAGAQSQEGNVSSEMAEDGSADMARGKGKARDPHAGRRSGCARLEADERTDILWVNDGKNVGVRFSVKEDVSRRDNPVLIQSDEDAAVSYEITFEGASRFSKLPMTFKILSGNI